MEAYYQDESTDDEVNVNLQLYERLHIDRKNSKPKVSAKHNKEFKQHCNGKRIEPASRKLYGNSLPSRSRNHGPSSPQLVSPYALSTKKRHNGDKNQEQLENPKRTCLSDRLFMNGHWRDSKTKISPVKLNCSCRKKSKSKYLCNDHCMLERGLSPDQTYECHQSTNYDNSDDSDFEVSGYNLRRKFIDKIVQSHALKDNLAIPSSSNFGSNNDAYELDERQGVQVIDSGESDEGIKLSMQNGALKGGRQSSDWYKRKPQQNVVDKILNSDDTDEEKWHADMKTNSIPLRYCAQPLRFSSDSEDSQDTLDKAKNSDTSEELESCFHTTRQLSNTGRKYKLPNLINDSSDEMQASTSSAFHSRKPQRIWKPQAKTKPPCTITELLPCRNCRNRHSASSQIKEVANQQSNSEFRITHVESLSGKRAGTNLATAYPDLFDAEDSSEVEFFTANSYSDTETSNESLQSMNRPFPEYKESISNSELSYDPAINVGSSEDEISVIFSSGPHACNIEPKRESRQARGRRYRGGACHRQVRGGACYRQVPMCQDVVALSPDPVEQVRQMEEDERLARVLQAQFDAEVDPNYAPPPSTPCLLQAASDEEIIDPVGEWPPSSMSPPFSRIRHQIRNPSNRGPVVVSSISFNAHRPAWTSNRRHHHDPWMLQLARFTQLLPNLISNPRDSVELEQNFLDLIEANGDVQIGLQKCEINRLPTRMYTCLALSSSDAGASAKRSELNKECQVCLSDYETGDLLRILPCFHEFHTLCIDPWLNINHTCPVCRVTVDLDE